MFVCEACHGKTACRGEHLKIESPCALCGRGKIVLACDPAKSREWTVAECRRAYRYVERVAYLPRGPNPGAPA